MLTITVLGEEQYDEESSTFLYPDKFDLELEHSLVSLSKWEEKWEVPFLSSKEKTTEMVLDYVRCMLLTPEPPPGWLSQLSQENLNEITAYFDAKMTATWFNERAQSQSTNETITAELVYYWMTQARIPWEAQYWHLNKLFTLIKIFGVKNTKQKPLGQAEAAAQRRAENRRRLEGG